MLSRLVGAAQRTSCCFGLHCGEKSARVSCRLNMPARTLLVFDLDGTLYRTAASFLPSLRKVYEEYEVPSPGDDAILSMVGETYKTFLEWLIPQGFPIGVAELGARITELEIEAIPTDGELFPDVKETLQSLRDVGCTIALCTNGDIRYATYVLDSHGILPLFAVLKTNDDDLQSKTDMIRDLLVELRPERSFVVGDRYHDVEAGLANGCVVVGAAYGYGKPQELHDADYVIERFADLLDVVGSEMNSY